MRDVRKVKNRLELKLDSTQVFFLFAGLVTFTAFVFILGVVVGRAQRADLASATVDALDLPSPTPVMAMVRDRLPERDAAHENAVETIYDLDQPDNPNSIAAAIPSQKATAKPTAKPAATPVSVAKTPQPTAKPDQTPASDRSRYTVQVAAYTDSDQAFQFVQKLRKLGIEAYSVTYAKPQGPTYHRVRVGRFVSKAEADEAARALGTQVAGVKPAVMLID